MIFLLAPSPGTNQSALTANRPAIAFLKQIYETEDVDE